MGGHGLASFRSGYQADDSWDIYAWVKNAFDKQHFEQPADQRTWGVTLRAKF